MIKFVLILVLNGAPYNVAVMENVKTCNVIANALNTHPTKGENAQFFCTERTDV